MCIVFSFCLYGPYSKKYYMGLIENIKIINKNYPEYYIYISFGNDIDKSIIKEIDKYKNIIYKIYDFTGAKLMTYRYVPIDLSNVSILFSRDVDSRINTRDMWCINEFIKSKYLIHIIRDHKNHNFPIMGGMVGFKKEFLKYITSFENIIRMTFNLNFKYLTDQIILAEYIYKKHIKEDIFLVHSKVNTFNEKNVIKIPLEVNKETFIGQVIDYDENNKKIYIYEYLEY